MLAACEPDKGFGKTVEIARGDYGADWPLTVESALLNRNQDAVLVQIDGYAVGIDVNTTPQDVNRAFRKSGHGISCRLLTLG